jgi:serine protease Do
MDRFVCVRMVQANGMDLSQFQFDFDLTFAAFFMNADKTIYGRYGSRSDHKDAMRNISVEGFRKALAAALEMHRKYPANKASLASKRGPASQYGVPEAYPSLRSEYTSTINFEGAVAKSCMHCHMVGEAAREVFRSARKPIPDEVLYPWPMPDVVGLTLDPQEKATVTRVAAGSPAQKGGLRSGDEILTLAGQPILSIADVQWVLHSARTPAQLKAELRRDGRRASATLSLGNEWRRRSDLSWRTTTWDLRRMGLGGLILEDLPAAERQKAASAESDLALRVKGVGQYGAHAVAKKAGFQEGDIIVAFDGQTRTMTESGLLAYAVQNRMPGDRVSVTVLRAGVRVDLSLPMQ